MTAHQIVGQIEKRTQARIVALFQQRLGYDYLGDKSERDNCNILSCSPPG